MLVGKGDVENDKEIGASSIIYFNNQDSEEKINDSGIYGKVPCLCLS